MSQYRYDFVTVSAEATFLNCLQPDGRCQAKRKTPVKTLSQLSERTFRPEAFGLLDLTMMRRSYLILLALQLFAWDVNAFTATQWKRHPIASHSSRQMAAVCASNDDSRARRYYSSALQLSMTTSLPLSNSVDQDNGIAANYRARLREMTGFSLTALRTVLRTMSGISLTAIYTSALALSGAWIRTIMASFLSLWPTWLRYFVQPLLILWYAPLLILREAAGPNRTNARRSHERVVEGWKKAVVIADGSSDYWPVHVNNQNELESDIPELDMKEAIAESAFISMEVQEKARMEGRKG